MNEDKNNDLDTEVLRYEGHAHWGARAVIFGLVIECIFAALFHNGRSVLENWTPVIADLFVALGVWAEVRYNGKASNLQKEIKRRSDVNIAELTERAAAMEKDAAEARRETERLKKEVSWRVLDAGTSVRLIEELSKIPSRVTLVFLSGDPEATAYCQRFYEVFVAAEWQVEVVGRTFLGPPVGIFVTHGDRWNPDIEAGIVQLRKALVTAGIQVESGGGAVEAKEGGFRAANNDLRVVIGHKPPPQIG